MVGYIFTYLKLYIYGCGFQNVYLCWYFEFKFCTIFFVHLKLCKLVFSWVACIYEWFWWFVYLNYVFACLKLLIYEPFSQWIYASVCILCVCLFELVFYMFILLKLHIYMNDCTNVYLWIFVCNLKFKSCVYCIELWIWICIM